MITFVIPSAARDLLVEVPAKQIPRYARNDNSMRARGGHINPLATQPAGGPVCAAAAGTGSRLTTSTFGSFHGPVTR